MKKESLLVRELEWADEYRKRVLAHASEIEAVDRLQETFTELEIESSYCGGAAYATVHVLSMKDIIPVLAYLRRSGYKYSSHADDATAKRRIYYLAHVDTKNQIVITAAIKQTTEAKCEYKIVGHETITRPIYKLVCSDGSENASAQSAEEPQEETNSSPPSLPEEPSSSPS